jgi:hypothetical protein
MFACERINLTKRLSFLFPLKSKAYSPIWRRAAIASAAIENEIASTAFAAKRLSSQARGLLHEGHTVGGNGADRCDSDGRGRRVT